MSKETCNNLEVITTDEIKTEVQEAIAELSFNTRAIGHASDDLTRNLSKASISIGKIISDFEQCIIKQEQNADKINAESRILCLIPEKIEERINKIAPQIASEVEELYNSKITELNDRFETLQNKLTQDFENCRQNLSATTDRCIDLLSKATEKFTSSIGDKLVDFSRELSRTAEATLNQKSIRFIKYLAFILFFSALVSGLTSYLVATRFPRYVEIKGANDLIINDSKVNVWGSRMKGQTKDASKIR